MCGGGCERRRGISVAEVSDELVDQMGEGWSGLVRFRIERIAPGRVELVFRREGAARAHPLREAAGRRSDVVEISAPPERETR